MLKIALRYGGLMFIGFTIFFFLMHMIGMSDAMELRYLNVFIQFGVLWIAIRVWLREHPDQFDNYTGAVALGLMVTTIGAGAFAIFLILFLYANPELMAAMRAQSPRVIAEHLNPGMAGFFSFGEAIIAALIGSYILIRIIEAKYYRSV